jgi:hypothetical protein
MSQNNPLVLVGFYQNLHHHAHQKQSSQYVIGFSYEKSAGHRGIDNVFFLEKSCRKM